MKFSKKQAAIFYIDKNKGEFFTKTLPSPLELNFPKDVFSHLEIIDRQKLEEFIQEFLETNKLQPCELFFLLGENTTFEKDITDIARTQRHIEIQKFLDIVPFEKTLNKVFKIQKKEKIVVANRLFCEELTQVFNEKGFKVYAIAPVSIILDLIPKLKDKVDLSFLIKKIDTIKKYNLLTSSDSQERPFSLSTPTFFQNSRLIILASIFASLLIVLGILIYTRFLVSKPKPKPKPASVIRVQQPTSTPINTSEATPSVQLKPATSTKPLVPSKIILDN